MADILLAHSDHGIVAARLWHQSLAKIANGPITIRRPGSDPFLILLGSLSTQLAKASEVPVAPRNVKTGPVAL
jgi:hypothetical protein